MINLFDIFQQYNLLGQFKRTMKRKILFISFIVIFCNLFAQQKLSRFQLQFKKLTQDSEYGDVYEIYLFDNTTD